MWNFDGVACAIALEYNNPVYLFHGNHLVFGFLGSCFWRLLIPFGMDRSLPALQLMTSLMSASAFPALYWVLQKFMKNSAHSILLVLWISTTAVVWVWSLEAQVYALGFLGLAWTTYVLFQPWTPSKWYKVGFLHAVSILGHVVHLVWIIPALYWLKSEKTSGTSRKHLIFQYLTTLFTGIGISYGLVLGTVILPAHPDLRWMRQWLLGSAALTSQRTFAWHWAGWSGFLQWAQTTPHLVWGSLWPYNGSPVPLWCSSLTGIAALVVLFLLAKSFSQRADRVWTFCALWLATYGLFFTTWEPTTECYRMTDIMPLALLIALAVKGMNKVTCGILLGFLLISNLLINYTTRIGPMNDTGKNMLFQQVTQLVKSTRDDTLFVTDGGKTWVYMLYFGRRSAWDIHSFRSSPSRLELELARHHHREPIYMQTSAASEDWVIPWIHHFTLKLMEPGSTWVELQ